jgi:hypothetical protein
MHEGIMSALEFAKYRFVMRPCEPIALPAYKGSTFRGGFGTVFRRVACVCGTEAVTHHRSCLYAQVFETPLDNTRSALPQTAHIPHPFVLEPPLDAQRVYTPDEPLVMHLVLIGRAIDWLPYFVFTFEELGRVGLGPRRGRYRLTEVHSVTDSHATPVFVGDSRQFLGPGQRMTLEEMWQPVRAVETIEVAFLTYTRISAKGQLRDSLDFTLLFGAILRRLALLTYAHGAGEPLPLPEGPMLDTMAILRYFYDRYAQDPAARAAIRQAFGFAQHVEVVDNRLAWQDWERWSERQGTRMKLGGVLGTVRYRGPVSSFLPYLRCGEALVAPHLTVVR